jgi:hypothetical protein
MKADVNDPEKQKLELRPDSLPLYALSLMFPYRPYIGTLANRA